MRERSPLALMIGPLGFLAASPNRARKRRRQSRGLRNVSVGSHHPSVTLGLQFALRREWLLTLDFADETAGYLKPLRPPRKSRSSPADASAEPWRAVKRHSNPSVGLA
jgi:hypothetical protein